MEHILHSGDLGVQMGGSKLFIDSDDGSRIFGEICDRQQSQEKAKEEAAE